MELRPRRNALVFRLRQMDLLASGLSRAIDSGGGTEGPAMIMVNSGLQGALGAGGEVNVVISLPTQAAGPNRFAVACVLTNSDGTGASFICQVYQMSDYSCTVRVANQSGSASQANWYITLLYASQGQSVPTG